MGSGVFFHSPKLRPLSHLKVKEFPYSKGEVVGGRGGGLEGRNGKERGISQIIYLNNIMFVCFYFL
jgi:hypothetical protein